MTVEKSSNPGEDGGVANILLRADGEAPRPGIVLLQEIFGLNASMRAIAEDFRSHGYDVLAPDLFSRQERGVQLDPTKPEDRTRAETLMKGLDEQDALADIRAAISVLKGLDTSNGQVAAVGYCLGGRLAYLAAAEGLVDSAVSYYGVAIHRSLALADRISVPMLLHIAEEDHLCDREAQQELRTALAGKKNFELQTHPGVGHAFARPNSPMWNEAAATSANGATFDFLATISAG